MASLADKNSLDRLFLLDGTDIDDWSNSVLEPALEITEYFLAGEQLPLPTELSHAAATVLAPKESYQPGAKVQHFCETCSMTTYTDVEWQKHVQSRSHRARVKNELKKSGQWKHGVKQSSKDLDAP
jgi:tRNA dimethylallyltransferase